MSILLNFSRNGLREVRFSKTGQIAITRQINVQDEVPSVDAPVANPDTTNAQIGSDQIVYNVLTNDTGTGRTLAATPTLRVGGQGTLDDWNADGRIWYTPPASGTAGDDIIDYTVTNDGGSDTSTLTISLTEAPPAGTGTVTLSSYKDRTTGTAPAGFFLTAEASGFGVEDYFQDVRYKWTFGDPGYYTANDTDDYPWDRVYNDGGTIKIVRGEKVYSEDGLTILPETAVLTQGVGYEPASGTATYLGPDKNIAYGKHVAHVFDTPGTYTVRCEVQKRGQAAVVQEMQIQVDDPDVVFSGTNTVCYSPTNDFTGKPTGAVETTTWASFVTALASGPVKRGLIRTGTQYSGGAPTRSSGWDKFQLGVFGPEGDGRPYRTNGFWEIKTNENKRDAEITIWGHDVIGSYDPANPWGNSPPSGGYGLWGRASMMCLWDVRIKGVYQPLELKGDTTSGGELGQSFGVILGNVRVTDWQHYGFFSADCVGYFGMCGVWIKQKPEAVHSPGSEGQYPWSAEYGPVRYAALSGPVAHNLCDWRVVASRTEAYQPVLRIGRRSAGSSSALLVEEAIMDRIRAEGGGIFGTGNASSPGYPRRYLWDKCIVAESWQSAKMFGPGVSGLVFRNFIFSISGRRLASSGFYNWVVGRTDTGTYNLTDDPLMLQYGVDIYNGTILDLRPSNFITDLYQTRLDSDYGHFKFGNCIIEHPDRSPSYETNDGPFDLSQFWDKTMDGVRFDSATPDTSYALPETVAALWAPSSAPPEASTSHSHANGDGSRIALDDIWGNVRTTAHRGPLEVW